MFHFDNIPKLICSCKKNSFRGGFAGIDAFALFLANE
jgi:hypothetical protein